LKKNIGDGTATAAQELLDDRIETKLFYWSSDNTRKYRGYKNETVQQRFQGTGTGIV
jgi:hypothetical protein